MSRKSFGNYPYVRYIFLSFMVIMLITLELQAQTQEQKLNLSINLRNATLQEFTKKIEEMTDYSFIYGEEVKIDRKISINLKDKTIEEILRFVFKNEPIDFKITGNYILLHKKTPKPDVRKYTVSGYITDNSSMETLIGANVFDSRIYQGTTTNPYGYYSLTLPEREVEISFSYLGYSTQKKTFVLKQDTQLNINLEANNVLDEVIIYSNKTESGFKATHTGAIDIPMAQIRNTPVVLGEADVMKTIQSMPGVQAGVEGSAGLYVRGGSPDQNLILLDGVPVYNVDHLLGFFSVFTPEAVKKVTLYKSSFPARFGGRLSSVIDVRTNDGDMNNYHGSFSLGLLSTRLNAEGPVIKDKTSFNISLRRTYLDLITRPFMKDDSKVGYYFYDITAKVNHKFSDKDRLFFSFYHGNDYLKTEYTYKDLFFSNEADYLDKEKGNGRWGNTILSTRWNRIINNKLFGNTTLAFNQYKLRLDSKSHHQYMETKNNYHTDYRSGIRDASLNINFDYNPIPKHHIKFGGTYLFHNFKPEVMTSKVSLSEAGMKEDTIYNSTSNSEIYAHEFSLYAEDDININSRLKTNIGLHVSGFHVQGKTYFSMQPRLATRYQLNDDVALKASYSKMNQYINLLTSAPISMPTDLWVPVTKKIKPMDAHQYSLGAYYTGFPGWELSVETYYKGMKNVLEYKDGTHIMGSSTSWEEKVEMGKGRSYGIEFMVQKTLGQSTGWISYALAKSDRKFARGGINNGERFPFKYDRRHSVDFIFNHKFSDKIDLGVSWTFMSGATASVAHEVVTIVTPHKIDDVDYIEGRNNYRLPPSHCLNVGINFHKKKKYGMRTWNFSVYNLYNTMNPTFVHRTIRYRENNNDIGEFVPVMKKFTLLPLLPSATYTYRF